MHYKSCGQLWRHREITLGTKLKMPIFTLYLPHNIRSRVSLLSSLCNRDTVSNKTYKNFRDKRLVRPGSKYPIWQRSQPISYKVKFSQRNNIYLADLKYNITYQNIQGSDRFLYQEMPKMAKSYLTTYMDELYTKSWSLFYPRKFTNNLPQFSSQNSGQAQK